MEFEPVSINGMAMGVRVERARLRNAHANVREGSIVIRLPFNMRDGEAQDTAATLYRRMRRAMEKNPSRFLASKRLEFHEGKTAVGGRSFSIKVSYGAKRPSVRMSGDGITAYLRDGDEGAALSGLVSRAIRKAMLPYVAAKVEAANKAHFGSKISKVRLRDNGIVWGSCSPSNAITINLKLLYAPEAALEYVIVHELAHTVVRSHSKRFWKEVERAMPSYCGAKLWLKDSSHLIST